MKITFFLLQRVYSFVKKSQYVDESRHHFKLTLQMSFSGLTCFQNVNNQTRIIWFWKTMKIQKWFWILFDKLDQMFVLTKFKLNNNHSSWLSEQERKKFQNSIKNWDLHSQLIISCQKISKNWEVPRLWLKVKTINAETDYLVW